MGARVTGTEILLARVQRLTRRLKVLRDDNQRLWESRERWKRKHADRLSEVQALRRRVRRLDESRLMWRSRVPRTVCRNVEPNVLLSRAEIERILRMPARD